MNGYGLEFWDLERIQEETEFSDDEMRRRNLALSTMEREILMDVPADGPPKYANKVKATNLHYGLNRGIPASLILQVQDSNGFGQWMKNIRNGLGRYRALKTHFVGLEI